MKILKIIPIALVGLYISCGSGEQVIMENGAVYKVKNNHFYSKGKDITESLSDNEKEDIKGVLDKRLEAERIAEVKQEKLQQEQEKVNKALAQAEAKQKALENSQKELENKQEALEDARENFLKAKENLQDKKDKYNKLKEKGKLSMSDEKKWEGRFQDLESKIEALNIIYKNLK